MEFWQGRVRQDGPALRPELSEYQIGDGEVVKDRFLGPVARGAPRQVIGRLHPQSWVGNRVSPFLRAA